MIKATSITLASATVLWGAWYASAAPLGGVCAPGRHLAHVPGDTFDADQASVCTG